MDKNWYAYKPNYYYPNYTLYSKRYHIVLGCFIGMYTWRLNRIWTISLLISILSLFHDKYQVAFVIQPYLKSTIKDIHTFIESIRRQFDTQLCHNTMCLDRYRFHSIFYINTTGSLRNYYALSLPNGFSESSHIHQSITP